jgi:hypothetical protein
MGNRAYTLAVAAGNPSTAFYFNFNNNNNIGNSMAYPGGFEYV